MKFLKKRFMLVCMLFSLLGVLPVLLSAQDNIYYAAKAAKELQEGTLAIRVFTNPGKLRQLRKLLASDEISESSRRKLEKQLRDTEKENDDYWNDLTHAVSAHYTFSKVVYMPDSLYKNFEAGEDAVFWDNARNIDTSVKMDRSSFFLLITGDNSDQLILVTKDLVRLDHPFPDRIVTFLPSFRRIFNRRGYFEKQLKGFQTKLEALIK